MTPQDDVLDCLARGLKDDAIARDLHMSVRTVRRLIAEYMVSVSATNRFQAGVSWAFSRLGAS